VSAAAVGAGVRLPLPLRRALAVLRRHAPTQATAVRATLPTVLAPLLAAPDDPACWRLSLLTDGGYPCEFTFTTAGPEVRYTVEVGPPRQSPERRLDQALGLLARFGAPAADPDGLALLQRVQAEGGLRYGAWLGVRHRDAARAFKIYAEVPPGGAEAALAFVNPRLRRPVGVAGRSVDPRMIGWNPATGETELYFRVRGVRPWELGALADPAGLARRAPEVLRLFQAACGRPIYQRLPGHDYGFSYTLPRDGAGGAFTFYGFSEALFGGDAGAVRRLPDFFAGMGAEMETYRAMAAPLAGYRGDHTYHGLFGVTVAHEGAPAAHVGLRPPEGRSHD
jgi:hypothetical protein